MGSWKISSLTDSVRRAFTDAASQYDILAGLQREIGRELVKKYVKLAGVERVLDVGCGTGYLAAKAKFFFPESRVVGIDFAEGMLAKAFEQHENLCFLAADAHQLPFKNESFELVLSNLAYQWAEDLPAAFLQTRRVLAKNGLFAATLFGQYTCDEFFSALEQTGTKTEGLRRLPALKEVEAALQAAGFSRIKTDYERIQIQFKDLWDLLAWLKGIGANRLSTGRFLGGKMLEEANTYCLKHYPYHEGIRITFEVIWVEAYA